MAFKHRDILGLQDLTAEEIELLLNTADNMKEISKREIKKVPTLRGKTVVNLFFEPSTRTRTSFEIAAKRLSADTLNISASTSAVQKGETLSDTARNIEAMKPDIIVMRHAISGAHHYLAKRVSYSVINAGDGSHEHPSQGLLDMMTIREKLGTLKGLQGCHCRRHHPQPGRPLQHLRIEQDGGRGIPGRPSDPDPARCGTPRQYHRLQQDEGSGGRR